jgi:hypothetical protein
VELASNLTWLGVSLVLIGLTLFAVHRGRVRVTTTSAVMLTLLVCFLLLPVISVSDDLIEARQAALPLSAQTWHMSSESASVGLEVSVIGDFLPLLGFNAVKVQAVDDSERGGRPMEAWLTPSQRLRPPPASIS